MRKEYLLDTKWACGLIVVGDDGKVIDACPIYRKKMLGLTIEEIKEKYKSAKLSEVNY